MDKQSPPVQNAILIETTTENEQLKTDIEDSEKKIEKKKNFFNKFTEKLKITKSENLKMKLLSFIKEMQVTEKYKPKEYKQKVVDFINDFEIEFQNVWKENSEEEYENGEAIEGIITKALYTRLISFYDNERDKNLELLFKIYDFIELHHLECKHNVIITASYDHALKHLNKIESYKTPKDKMISIINCCKIVSGMVCKANKENSKPTGADDFLPVLIYIVLKAKPKNPLASIEFIRDYRSNIRLRGEEDYYFTAYDSAINFIENLNSNQLKIDQKEFNNFIDIYSKKVKDESFLEIKSFQTPINNENNKAAKVSETEMADFQNVHIHNFKNKISDIKSLFNVIETKKMKFFNKETQNLTIAEVGELLNEHKFLGNMMNEIKKKILEMGTYCEDIENEGIQKNKKTKKMFGFF